MKYFSYEVQISLSIQISASSIIFVTLCYMLYVKVYKEAWFAKMHIRLCKTNWSVLQLNIYGGCFGVVGVELHTEPAISASSLCATLFHVVCTC